MRTFRELSCRRGGGQPAAADGGRAQRPGGRGEIEPRWSRDGAEMSRDARMSRGGAERLGAELLSPQRPGGAAQTAEWASSLRSPSLGRVATPSPPVSVRWTGRGHRTTSSGCCTARGCCSTSTSRRRASEEGRPPRCAARSATGACEAATAESRSTSARRRASSTRQSSRPRRSGARGEARWRPCSARRVRTSVLVRSPASRRPGMML